LTGFSFGVASLELSYQSAKIGGLLPIALCFGHTNYETQVSLEFFSPKVSHREPVELNLYDLNVPLSFELLHVESADLAAVVLVNLKAHSLQQTLTPLKPCFIA